VYILVVYSDAPPTAPGNPVEVRLSIHDGAAHEVGILVTRALQLWIKRYPQRIRLCIIQKATGSDPVAIIAPYPSDGETVRVMVMDNKKIEVYRLDESDGEPNWIPDTQEASPTVHLPDVTDVNDDEDLRNELAFTETTSGGSLSDEHTDFLTDPLPDEKESQTLVSDDVGTIPDDLFDSSEVENTSEDKPKTEQPSTVDDSILF
jgi:hypothetical protein